MNWLKRNEIAVFLFLSFALSWFIWPLTLQNPNSTPMLPWGPLISVLIVLGFTRGWAGIKKLLADMFRWRVGIGWYAFILLVPIGVTLAAVYINVALGAPAPPVSVFAIDDLLSLIPGLLITTLIAGPLTEEPAWRGYFLPHLQKKYSPLVASLIIGVIWWSWHLPLMISDPLEKRPPLQFFGLTLAFSILYTWVYNRARASLLLIALLHGVTNRFAGYLFPHQFGESYLRLWWVYVALWWAVTLFFVLRSSAPIKTDQPVVMEGGHQQST